MNDKENINFIFHLENKSRATSFFILFIVSGILFVGAAFFFVAANMNYELIATIVAAIAYFVVFSKIKPSFFELVVTDQMMQINFYQVSSVARNYQSIEMYLHQLKDFHIENHFLGLKKSLVISVESKYGIADYPPVSISILNKNEIARVKKVLTEIIKSK